jgi:hypothetical protein
MLNDTSSLKERKFFRVKSINIAQKILFSANVPILFLKTKHFVIFSRFIAIRDVVLARMEEMKRKKIISHKLLTV